MIDDVRKVVPTDPNEFDNVLLRIDRQLASEGVSVCCRLPRARGLFSSEFGIPLPLGPLPAHMSHPAGKYWPISKRIQTWYEHRYGERLKSYLGPGRMAFLIDADVWIFRFPLFFGKVRFIASRTTASVRMGKHGAPAVYNILDSIENLPDGLRGSLSDSDLRQLFEYFIFGFHGLRRLQTLQGDELVESSFADIDACINHLLGDRPNYSLAKWSSLQAGEKVLKATIRKTGAQYAKTHELSHLAEDAHRAGLCLDIKTIIGSLQCSPGIRYGNETCTLRQAIEAHHAVFKLAREVTEALKEFLSHQRAERKEGQPPFMVHPSPDTHDSQQETQ